MKQSLRKHLTLTAILLAGLPAWAAPLSFDFKDPKGVNNAIFHLDAPLEAIAGNANGISGTVQFDPANPAATRGRIVVASSSLHVGNPMMKEHLHGAKWIDSGENPEITFEVKELRNVKTDGDVSQGEAVGTFTLKGVSREITVPVKLTYLKGKLGQRMPNKQGDLLVIRSQFSIKRSDFNINPGQNEDKVSNDIQLTLSIAGSAPTT